MRPRLDKLVMLKGMVFGWGALAMAAALPSSAAGNWSDDVEIRRGTVQISAVADPSGRIAFEATGIPATMLEGPTGSPLEEDVFRRLMNVRLADDQNGALPPMAGSYRVISGKLRFVPRYPLTPGLRYRVSVAYGNQSAERPSTWAWIYEAPAVDGGERPRVTRIDPTAVQLPENLLRFYVHFSAPMSRGDSYRHLDLLDDSGKPVELAFLEIGEELWDRSGSRLTLLIDPGRIKRGLKPREESGPVLEQGRGYTLLIRESFEDAKGRRLLREHRKRFTTMAPIEERVDPLKWRLSVPAPGTTEPLQAEFGRTLDRALLERALTVTDGSGRPVEGAAEVGVGETSWSFQPVAPWAVGDYRLVVDSVLEDVAGNSVSRAFEVDEHETVTATARSEMATVPFRIGALKSTSSGPEVETPPLPPNASRSTGKMADPETQWHHWRGPWADGTARRADPPIHWGVDRNIRWKATLEGRGSSTPIIWNDRVFVLSATPTDRVIQPGDRPEPDPKLQTMTEAPKVFYRFVVYCFDRMSGKLIWKKTAAEKAPHEGHHVTHSYAAGSPTTDGKRLYAAFGSFGVYCYSLDGELIWERDLGRLHTRRGWGEAVTPVVFGDFLLLNWDQEMGSKLVCLDPASGETRWETPRDEVTSWNTPWIQEHDGVIQVILNGTNRIRGYELETGKELWQCDGMSINAIPSPVGANGVVYVMSGYRGHSGRAIRLDARGDVSRSSEVLWRIDKGTPYVPSPLLVDGRLYFTQANNAMLTVLDAATGAALLDRVRLPGQMSFYASPIAAQGRVYLVDRSGATLVLRRKDAFEVLATNHLDDTIDASPAAVGRQLYLRSMTRLYCIEQPGS